MRASGLRPSAYVVHVHHDRLLERRVRARADAANLDDCTGSRLTFAEIRYVEGEVIHVVDACLHNFVAGEDRHRNRHVLQALLTFLCSNDYLFENASVFLCVSA